MIKLAEPTAGYAKEIMELRQEFLDEDPNVYIHGGGDLERYRSAKEWICHVENMRRRETCPEHLVDSDIYLAIREEDDRILGIVELRHHIDHPVLREWGGHIGYCIRPGPSLQRRWKSTRRAESMKCCLRAVRIILPAKGQYVVAAVFMKRRCGRSRLR